MRLVALEHAEIRMVENAVEDITPLVATTRVEQRLHRDAVREQKDDAQQCEVEQFNHLRYIALIGKFICKPYTYLTLIQKAFRPRLL